MTGTWAEFAAAFALFMLAHRIPTMARYKAGLQNRIGQRGFTLAYSALSLLLLAWVIAAANAAPIVAIWDQSQALRGLANLVMPAAILLAAFAVAAPNPLSFGGRADGFDPAQPGIVGVARHPLLWALLLWSLAHLFANGDLAHILLFGSFALFSLFGMFAIDARKRRQMGAGPWNSLARNSSGFPFAALLSRRWHPRKGPNLLRLALGLGIWLGLLAAHQTVIGVSPLAW